MEVGLYGPVNDTLSESMHLVAWTTSLKVLKSHPNQPTMEIQRVFFGMGDKYHTYLLKWDKFNLGDIG